MAAPAFVYTVWIRYLTRDRPHLGGASHWEEKSTGDFGGDLHLNVLDYPGAFYLGVIFIFNVLWVYAFLRFREKPKFVRATLLLIPAFLIPHMITGVIMEVRQMIPLGFVVIPAAMFWMFSDELGADR